MGSDLRVGKPEVTVTRGRSTHGDERFFPIGIHLLLRSFLDEVVGDLFVGNILRFFTSHVAGGAILLFRVMLAEKSTLIVTSNALAAKPRDFFRVCETLMRVVTGSARHLSRTAAEAGALQQGFPLAGSAAHRTDFTRVDKKSYVL